MATLVTQTPKEALIADAISAVPSPEGVRLRRFYFDTDWSGDPCVRVVLGVSKKYELTTLRVRELAEFRRAISSALWALDMEEMPYTSFEDVR